MSPPEEEGPVSALTLHGAQQTPSLRTGESQDGNGTGAVNDGHAGAVDSADEGGSGRAQPGPTDPAALPCLNRNNSIESPSIEGNQLSPYAKKTAFALTANIAHLADVHGIKKLVFVTIGFADPDPADTRPDPSWDGKEAQRRLNSLLTNVLRDVFSEMIIVPERGGKGGRLHYHMVAAQEHDVRTGVDFNAIAEKDYSSAPKALRQLWALMREKLPKYGFGGWHEVMPIKSTAEGISRYVGKYIAKQFAGRRKEDKGMRLVRYTKGTNTHRATFSWNSPGAKLWRWQVGEFARKNHCASLDELSEKFPNWAYRHREEIMAIEPPTKCIGIRKDHATGEEEIITLWDVWYSRRAYALQMMAAQQAAAVQERATDSRVAERYEELLARELATHARHLDSLDEDGDPVDRIIVWADGRIEPSKFDFFMAARSATE